MYSLDDTIAAISTALGHSGVGIIKVSGPDALPIAKKLFRSARGVKKFQPYRLHYGHIIDPQTDAIIDEAPGGLHAQHHTAILSRTPLKYRLMVE